jgi:hypothetical protein
MAAKRSSTKNAQPAAAEVEAAATKPLPSDWPTSDWMAQAVAQGIKPEQALACIGLGLMQKMAGGGDAPWVWSEAEDGGMADLAQLRQRLELIQLALDTGAPLSTAEVAHLLGARPGAAEVQRGGLRARRLGRNVWKLSRSSGDDGRGDQLSSNPFARRF